MMLCGQVPFRELKGVRRHKCPPNPGVYNARGIYEIITGEHIPACPKGMGTKSMQISNSCNNIESSNWKQSEIVILGDNYPDPFTDYTFIPYELPVNTRGKIIVKDVLGKTIRVEQINSDIFELKLQTNNWALGVYYYSLEIDNEIIDTKRMIIAR